MQAPPGSQRRQQRASPSQDPDGMPPQYGPASSSNASAGGRVASGSGKTTSRRKDPATQLSQIEKSVTHLLVATKQLLETLTQWSRNQATEGEVSDVYVRLGYEFNIACRAFTSIGVSVDDLGPVPDQLRAILEETLSQEASPQSLDRFLPKIRDIIISLLHGLKRKQSRLRAARSKDGAGSGQDSSPGPGSYPRQQQTINAEIEDMSSERSSEAGPRQGSQRSMESKAPNGRGSAEEPGVPQRTTSVPGSGPLTPRDDQPPSTQEFRARLSKERRLTPNTENESTASSAPNTNLPTFQSDDIGGAIQRISLQGDTPAPPPPPKQQDAIAALQRGGELERRASRRYSAYQISKHLGASPGGVPMLPPTQNSPIPNRGRDVRESLDAVRTRSSLVPGQARSQPVPKDISPGRNPVTPSNESKNSLAGPMGIDQRSKSKSPDTRPSSSTTDGQAENRAAMSGTVNGPVSDTLTYEATPANQSGSAPAPKPRTTTFKSAVQPPADAGHTEFVPEVSPQPGKELTLFLQYKSRIKKIVLPEGSNDLSVARLQLAFIEKFAWNTHNNGVDLPEIYVQDTVSGVRHELEDLSDIKDRSVLVLNVEPLDEIKKHIDENFGGLRKVVEGMRTALDGQQATISEVSDRQQESTKNIARLAAAPPTPRSVVQSNGVVRSPVVTESAVRDVQTLRRDLAIMRQTLSSFGTTMQSSMAAIRSKADTVKAKAVEVAIPVFDSDSGRAYVNTGKKTLGDDSDSLVNRVDDLQDIVEDLRKDVVQRGVRPLPRQLEDANKDISEATRELKKMQEYVKREKPTWTKIWEKELQLVCDDREYLTMQEDLIADLEDDLEKATQTMSLVEQATKQQNVQASAPGAIPTLRPAGRNVPTIDTANVDPLVAKDGVLGQVRALQPNHETRLEAIERAEKARQRELSNRGRDAAFKKELGSFVDEGKLKKSGGVDEVDRLRRTKDERAMKGEYDEQQSRRAERAKARAEERARLAVAAQSASSKEDKPEDEEGNESAEEEMQDAEEGTEASPSKHEDESGTPASPSGRRSWLPSFMSSGSNN